MSKVLKRSYPNFPTRYFPLQIFLLILSFLFSHSVISDSSQPRGRSSLFFTISQSLVKLMSLVAQMIKNLPAMWETWVQSLGWEAPLEEGMAATPVFLPGESHGQRSLVGCCPRGGKESDTTE